MICAKLKIELYGYFVTSVFSFILNIASKQLWHENIQTDTNAFDFQEIESVG